MARPRKRPEPEQQPEDAAGEERADVTVINLKGSRSYVKFLNELHRKTLIPKASLFRQAMKEYCQNHGHDLPPEF